MKKRKLLFTILIFVVLTIISFFFDKKIVLFISGIRNIFFDYILLSVTFLTNSFIILFFLTTLFLWKEHKRRWILPLWLSLGISSLASFLIKIIIQRPRPFQEGIVSILTILFYFMKSGFSAWDFSFPSFHSILVFSALPVLNKEFKQLKYFWLIFALLVAFSRVYFGVHYLSDVLAGGIIGYLIGYFMVYLEEKYSYGLKFAKKIKFIK
jgi:undecaprenyl-diphosphatase